MRHGKELMRSDKSKVLIEVSCFINSYSREIEYNVNIATKEPKKRNWKYVSIGDDWEYRKLNMEDRKTYLLQKQLELVTEEEIFQAKIECWEKLRPTK